MKKWSFIVAMTFLTIAYLFWEYQLGQFRPSDVVTTSLAIIAGVAFWLEMRSNDKLNEAKFIMELNNQFISNHELAMVEWELEKYYAKFMNNSLTEQDNAEFRSKYDLSREERQYLVNYLVHLEGIAAILNEGVMHLDAIQDLMAYRYFIAVNNPIVQELELIPYQDHYRGCHDIYDKWKIDKEKIPMSVNGLKDK